MQSKNQKQYFHVRQLVGAEAQKVKVTCLQTGITYNSIREAAEATGMLSQAVRMSVKNDREIKGLQFKKAEE